MKLTSKKIAVLGLALVLGFGLALSPADNAQARSYNHNAQTVQSAQSLDQDNTLGWHGNGGRHGGGNGHGRCGW